jgi:hypothetical protein
MVMVLPSSVEMTDVEDLAVHALPETLVAVENVFVSPVVVLVPVEMTDVVDNLVVVALPLKFALMVFVLELP